MAELMTSKKQRLNRNSSKGNQLKWSNGTVWYKADYLGYEALSEYIVSHLLNKSTVTNHAIYEIISLQYLNNNYVGCQCNNFLTDGQEVITLEKLFRLYKNQDLTRTLVPMTLKERLIYVVDYVTDITGLSDFSSYLTMLLEIDAFFLNEDRHMNNIAVLRNSDKTFSYCPVFDNGAALFSDTAISYPLNIMIENCYDSIEAKPFSRSFDEQLDTAEELYGVHFSYWFQKQDLNILLDEASSFYPPEIIDRVYTILLWQIRKYQYFRKFE